MEAIGEVGGFSLTVPDDLRLYLIRDRGEGHRVAQTSSPTARPVTVRSATPTTPSPNRRRRWRGWASSTSGRTGSPPLNAHFCRGCRSLRRSSSIPTGGGRRDQAGQHRPDGRGDHLLGTDLAEEFVGNGGGDEIRGRGGDDFIGETFDGEGGSGDDSFWGDAGDDYLDGGGGLDDLHGGDGNDGLRDVGGRVSVDGGAGNDSFSLRLRFADGQLVEGGDGRDRVTLFNFFGAHLQRVDVLADLPARVFTMALRGAERSAEVGSVESLSLPDYGSWTILGTDASERFQAFVQSVEIHAGGGADVLVGGAGDDLLAGGAGDDRARPRRQRHLLRGRAGALLHGLRRAATSYWCVRRTRCVVHTSRGS